MSEDPRPEAALRHPSAEAPDPEVLLGIEPGEDDRFQVTLTANEGTVWRVERAVHLIERYKRTSSTGELVGDDREVLRLLRALASKLRQARTQNKSVDRARAGL